MELDGITTFTRRVAYGSSLGIGERDFIFFAHLLAATANLPLRPLGKVLKIEQINEALYTRAINPSVYHTSQDSASADLDGETRRATTP